MTTADIERLIGMANIVKLATGRLCLLRQTRHGRELRVHTTRDVHTVINGAVHRFDPCIGKIPALVRNADDQGFHTSFRSLSDAHIRQAKIRLAAFEADLSQTPIAAPMRHTVSRLCGQLIRHVANEHQVWTLNLDHRFFPAVALRFKPFFFSPLKAS